MLIEIELTNFWRNLKFFIIFIRFYFVNTIINTLFLKLMNNVRISLTNFYHSTGYNSITNFKEQCVNRFVIIKLFECYRFFFNRKK